MSHSKNRMVIGMIAQIILIFPTELWARQARQRRHHNNSPVVCLAVRISWSSYLNHVGGLSSPAFQDRTIFHGPSYPKVNSAGISDDLGADSSPRLPVNGSTLTMV